MNENNKIMKCEYCKQNKKDVKYTKKFKEYLCSECLNYYMNHFVVEEDND